MDAFFEVTLLPLVKVRFEALMAVLELKVQPDVIDVLPVPHVMPEPIVTSLTGVLATRV